MERTARPKDGAPPAPAGVTFAREADIGPDAYRDLHRKVGEEWLWWERIVFDDAALSAAISDPATEIYILGADGELAGFTELDRSAAEAPIIRYFGLAPEFIGRGRGGKVGEKGRKGGNLIAECFHRFPLSVDIEAIEGDPGDVRQRQELGRRDRAVSVVLVNGVAGPHDAEAEIFAGLQTLRPNFFTFSGHGQIEISGGDGIQLCVQMPRQVQ